MLDDGLAARVIHPPRRNKASLGATGSAMGLFPGASSNPGRADLERLDTSPGVDQPSDCITGDCVARHFGNATAGAVKG